MSALETRRRRIEELRNQTTNRNNIATTIADQWRRQRDNMDGVNFPAPRSRIPITTTIPSTSSTTLDDGGPRTPPLRQLSAPSRVLFDDDSTDSDSDDDDPDNKFSSSMNEIRRTPPPTFLTPTISPSTSTDSPSHAHDDDSSRNAYTLSCKFCAKVLTTRGMRARLVADARVHIWSTDEKPAYVLFSYKSNYSVILSGQKYATTTCQCQLM